MGELKAVICDLDGTVLKNEHVYGNAFSSVLRSLGAEPDDSIPQVTGIGVGPNWKIFLTKYNIQTEKTIDELVEATQKAYLENINEVNLTPGFEEFAAQVKSAGIRLALATSNTDKMLDIIAEKFNLKTYFEVITTSDDVPIPKPDPALFLTSADKLNVRPADSVVIEDAYAGIVAAQRAGMKTVGISANKQSPDISKSDLQIANFFELTIEKLQRLFTEE